jgi:two-component system chemotaxis sensor kinase CheA
MSMQDDETLQMYLEESREHLADIETDLLAIEENGADIDETLVNKVYRAAHSIKGGAGFMGLSSIKDLTHEMENILGKIRSRDMTPNPEIINILLLASDALREMINDVESSNERDISEHVQALQAIAEGQPVPDAPPAPEPAPAEQPAPAKGPAAIASGSSLQSPLSGSLLEFPEALVADAREAGHCLYLVEIDLVTDVVAKDQSPGHLVEEMESTGTVLASSPSIETVSHMQIPPDLSSSPFAVLFSTILKPEDINVLFNIDKHRIFEWRSDGELAPIAPPPTEPAASEPDPPSAAESLPDSTSTVMEKTETDIPSPPPGNTDAPPTAPGRTSSARGKESKAPPAETNLRVNITLLDSLMNLAGELVLGRNQLIQAVSSNDFRTVQGTAQRLDLITSELQEAIMLTRMQPIGNVFNKFPRVVRDLARNLGKQVDLNLEGKGVELDKTIIEAIGDPLTHLVRNAVDHGIETPDVRQRAGKNPVGIIHLRAYHEAGQVNIEIDDDGKGLDVDKITDTAINKGLVNEEQAKLMSEKERRNLIFLPGFSTAEKITDVSGRGVGMDVVKTNLDRLGGIVDLDSELGKGSTIRIKLPLTLAIIPSQIIVTGGERYAIPQVNMEELLRIPADQAKNRIEMVGDAEVVRLRGNLLPLVKLADLIEIEPLYVSPVDGSPRPDRRKSLVDRRSPHSPYFKNDQQSETDEKQKTKKEEATNKRDAPRDRRYRAQSALNIVVVSTGAMRYGLVVDDLNDSEEIVVKPLGRHLKQCKGYAGATIMGDGRVALILDVSNLAQMAGLTSMENSDRTAEIAKEAHEENLAGKDKQSLLLFKNSIEEQFAIPLNQVERIEKINRKQLEVLGGKRVMQYRGGSLPLFTVDQVAAVQPVADLEDLLVIVFFVADKEVGLLAIGPVDTVETRLDLDGVTLKQTGIMGSTIINDMTTLLVDTYELVQTVQPDWFNNKPAVSIGEDGNSPKILLAEDSNFFRAQVVGFIKDEGYTVIEAEDGLIAWQKLEDHADEICLVVTDIEMPNMNGFEFTKKLKADPRFAHLPVIALTTLASEEDVATGKAVGIDDYQIKLDREKLVLSISNYINARMK